MKIEIWSDIMCPFCYIGKRHLELALEQFKSEEPVEISWHSFQLDPSIPFTFEKPVNVYQYLADRKGISLEQSLSMHENVVQMAKSVGLDYQFDKSIVANSYDAHRIIQLAKTKKLDSVAEELFFKAYFTEGRDLADKNTLLELAIKIGLQEEEIIQTLTEKKFSKEIEADIQEAANLGIRGVPFFVINRQYGISGAQPVAAFLETFAAASEKITN